MAFQLGTFIVNLLGDTSHLDAAMKRVTVGVQAVTDAVKGASGGGLAIPGAEATKTTLQGAASAGRSLGSAMRSLLDIDLSTVLQLGTIAGVVGLLQTATKKFMDLSDEAKNTEFRFRMLRMETEENTKKFFAFGKQMQESFGIAAAESRKLQMEALTKGINPGRYQEMTAAAVGLAAATGKSTGQAMNVITQLEAGNTRVLRGMHSSFRIAMEQGASRFTLESMVNDMISRGADIQKERMNTFGGQLTRLQNEFKSLGVAVAGAIGPAFAPMISKMADAIEGATKKLTAYIDANKETIGHTVRMGSAIAVGAASLFLFRNQAAGIVSLLGHLVPSLGSVWSAFEAGTAATPFASLLGGIKKLVNVIKGLVGFTLQAGLQAALFLFSPTRIWATITGVVLTAYKLIVGGVGIACGVAAGGAQLLAMGIRAILVATGVGILVGLIGMMIGFADTFGNAATGVDGFGAAIKAVFNEFRDLAEPILNWLKTEGQIVFKALIAAARQMVESFQMIWGLVEKGIATAMSYIKKNFGESIKWLEDTFGIKIDSIESMWAEFTAELAVLGLRIRQIFLYIILGLAMVPTVVEWLGKCFRAFADYVSKDWKNALIETVNVYVEYLKVLGFAIVEIGDGIAKALNGETVTFDFTATELQFAKLKEQAGKVLADIKMPALDVSNVAPELRGEIDKVTKEINEKKQLAREAQAKDRLNAQNKATGKTDGGTTDPKGQVLIGGRDKAHFQETVGFWKKVQEAGANQRAEHMMQQQLDQQREMVRLLNTIAVTMAAPPPRPPEMGVVPR